MSLIAKLGGACALLALTACASPYESQSLFGGYREEQIGPDVWTVEYSGNGYTSDETVQTYWLSRCAQLAIAKGYDGFRLTSPTVQLSGALAPAPGPARVFRVVEHGLDGKPYMLASIQLIRAPLPREPGRIFDARALTAFLAPYIGGACGSNVCPHVHRYLFPDFGPSKPEAPKAAL